MFLDKQNMHTKHAYKLKFFSPFLSIINKGVKETKTKCSPPFCSKTKTISIRGASNKSIIKVYAIYNHEEEDAKLTSLHICIT